MTRREQDGAQCTPENGLARIAAFEAGWDGEDAPPPSAWAIEKARDVIAMGRAAELADPDVDADVLGGVAVAYALHGGGSLWIACMNTGTTAAVCRAANGTRQPTTAGHMLSSAVAPLGIRERRPGIFQVAVDVFFADGDGAQVFLRPVEHDRVEVTDLGFTLSRWPTLENMLETVATRERFSVVRGSVMATVRTGEIADAVKRMAALQGSMGAHP